MRHAAVDAELGAFGEEGGGEYVEVGQGAGGRAPQQDGTDGHASEQRQHEQRQGHLGRGHAHAFRLGESV